MSGPATWMSDSSATRIGRDSLDRALVDLAGLYRDALILHAPSNA